MTNRSLVLWSLGLSLPLQYCWMLGNLIFKLVAVGVEHHAGSGAFGCTNFHESGLRPCTLGEMLLNPLMAMLLLNFVTCGVLFIVTASAIAVVLLALRSWRGAISVNDKRDLR